MHLEIKQANDRTEQVSSTCIDKLYNLSKNGLLDATSDLRGSINAASAYEDAVTFLNTMWGPNLIVTASAYYIRFADPEVVNALISAGVMQEGAGLTTIQAGQVSCSLNTSRITSFDELIYFTYWNKHEIPSFSGGTLLESIDLTNLEKAGPYLFRGCSNLKWFHGKNDEPYVVNLVNFNSFLSTASYNMFKGCVNLKHVLSFGDWMTFFPNGTFEDCTALEDVAMPVTCVTLGHQNFIRCSSLTTVNISQVTTIGANVFNGCSSLEYCNGPNSTRGELNLPNLTVTLGDGAFKGCTKLTSVASLGSITSIGDSAFENCTTLATINIPITVISIGDNAFYNTAWYNTLYSNSSDGFIVIGATAYAYKGTLPTSITIPNNVKCIGANLFNSSSITDVTIPSGVLEIKYRAFRNCANLTTVSLPTTIETIGTDAFVGCTSLTGDLQLPSIKTIGAFAFIDAAITSLTIGSQITSFGAQSFQNCTNLTTVTINATTPPSLGNKTFDGDTSLAHIYVPSGSVAAYKAKSGWSTYSSIIEAIPTT